MEVVADNVQFLGGRADGESQFVPAGAGQTTEPDFPASAADDDIPFLARKMSIREPCSSRNIPEGAAGAAKAFKERRAKEKFDGTTEDPADAQASGSATAPGRRKEAASSARTRWRRSTTEPERAPALHLGEGEDPQPPHHRRLRRHQRQVAVAVKRAREMALLPYVEAR